MLPQAPLVKQATLAVPYGVLSTTTGINGKIAASTLVYTVPAGKTCVATALALRVSALVAVISDPKIELETNSGLIFSETTLTPFTSTSSMALVLPATGGAYFLANAGDTINVTITVGASATTLTLVADLIGYLI